MRFVDQGGNESEPSRNGMDTAARSPRLDRVAIEAITSAGKRLIVQGAMGIHASDGLAGKVAATRSALLVGAGTVSAVVKSEAMLRAEIRRARDPP